MIKEVGIARQQTRTLSLCNYVLPSSSWGCGISNMPDGYRINILRTIAIDGVVRTLDVDEMDYVSR